MPNIVTEWQECTGVESKREDVGRAVQNCVGRRPKTVVLALSEKDLVRLPTSLESFAKLKNCTSVLRLDGNKLDALPSSVGTLRKLTQLHAQSNQIRSVADDICHGCMSLQALLLHSNKLEALPVEIGRLKQLHTLTLTFNELTALPAAFGELQSLKKLSLSHNQIWPSTLNVLARLTKLKQLAVSNNALHELPDRWVDADAPWCASLEDLDVHENALVNLPTGISNLVCLKKLDASSNRLVALPPSICDISQLEMIDVSGNPLNRPPLVVANRGIVAIRRFFPTVAAEDLARAKAEDSDTLAFFVDPQPATRHSRSRRASSTASVGGGIANVLTGIRGKVMRRISADGAPEPERHHYDWKGTGEVGVHVPPMQATVLNTRSTNGGVAHAPSDASPGAHTAAALKPFRKARVASREVSDYLADGGRGTIGAHETHETHVMQEYKHVGRATTKRERQRPQPKSMSRRGTIGISLVMEVAGRSRRQATVGIKRGSQRFGSFVAGGGSKQRTKSGLSTGRDKILRGHSIFGALQREYDAEEKQKANEGAAGGSSDGVPVHRDSAELAAAPPWENIMDRIAKGNAKERGIEEEKSKAREQRMALKRANTRGWGLGTDDDSDEMTDKQDHAGLDC